MGQLLQLILDNLFKLWPVRIMRVNEQGVRLHHNGTLTLLEPGPHFFFPGLHRIERYDVNYQVADCDLQSLTTADGVEVTLSLNLGYRVRDFAKMYETFQHFDTTLINVARGHVLEVVSGRSYADLCSDPKRIAREILSVLREEFQGSGVKLVDARLDQFVKTRQYRLLGASHFN